MMAAHRSTPIKILATAIASLLTANAFGQAAASPPLPVIVHDGAHPAPWPSSVNGTTWVPVFMLGDGDGSILASPFSAEPAGSVLLGIAQVRSSSAAADSVSVSPSLRWSVTDELRLGAAMTVTEFVPCRSTLQ